MNFSERNRLNIISRWNKIHKKEILKINHNTFHKSRICGFLAGDGNLVKKRYYVRFYPDNKSLIFPYCESIKFVYRKNPIINEKRNHYELFISSKIVYQDLIKYCNFSTKNWNIPTKLFDKKENIIEWLKAFFDSEGYVGNNHIKVSSVNGNGLYQIQNLLLKFNIGSKIYKYKPKNINHSKTYQLFIQRKENILRYKEIIGFNHAEKLSKLYKLV